MPRRPVTIEGEKNEIIIKNSNGDYAIIPTKLRGRVQSMIENGCDECIDDLVSTLPSMDFYTKANKAAKGAVVSGETGGVQPTQKRKVVVVSEYPLKSEYDLDKAVSESYKKRLPKDLQNIATKYDQSLTKYSEASTKRKQLINDVKNAYLATNPNKTEQTLTEADLSIIQDVYTKNVADLKLEDPEKAYKEVEANVAEFYKSDTNPKKRDETFPKEGSNIVDYFKKKDPNVEVVLKNAYKDDPNSIKDLKETLSSLNPQDDIVIQAHQGANKILGFSNSEFASMLGQSPAETIYAGVCNFGETCEPYKQLNKNLYYRPDTPWLGFDPTADTFLEGMYRRTYSDQGKTIVSPLIEGKSYISRPKQ